MEVDDKTIRILKELLAAQPQHSEARAHLAELYLQAEQPLRALQVLEGGGSVPDDEETSLLYARILAATDSNRAVELYLAIVQRNKACAAAHSGLAQIYKQRGLLEDAKRHYGIATVIDASYEDPAFEAWLVGKETPGEKAPTSPSTSETGRSPAEPDEDNDETNIPTVFRSDEEDLGERDQGDAILRELDLAWADTRLPKITFRDVGGMEEVKERIHMNIIYPFKNPQVFERYKRTPGGGILLYGPPGCGKTYTARATAGECEAHFIAVGITDVLSKWIGESEQRLHQLFAQARRMAPTVLFIDEVDALGLDRVDATRTSLATVTNQLLEELDGVRDSNEGVLVLAATNAPWNVDVALRRPGRFDRVIFIPPPDEKARAAIFEVHLRDLPTESMDFGRLARATRNFSGADIRAAIRNASDDAIYQELKSGKAGQIREGALLKTVKSMRPTTLEWLETARSYASYANIGGQYDDLVEYFRGRPK
ncbi:MAG: AAA family ATPase [Candidatus Latescibacterota bacterium]|nr:MAG: AAA family ATPase [Candidatus Latescibacterota bacterium]